MPTDREPLFRVAVISDTHLKLPEEGRQMLWATHHLANLRTQFAIEQIRRLAPDFVVHLGDKIHPIPGMREFAATGALFDELFSRLECPLYHIPGNHDLGDKPGAAMPAPVVRPESLVLYEEVFGPTYQTFERSGIRFVLLNNPLLNSGLPAEKDMQAWLEQTLRRAQRTFLFMHYPAYLADPAEPGHYDNLDEPARSWLLGLLKQHGVEAAFAGHTHTFFFNRYGDTELYVVPSVTFVRQDYSELFRVGPSGDFGRNDLGKFGFIVLHVYAEGHEVQFIRTAGVSPEDQAEDPLPLMLTNPSSRPFRAPLGVELRHPWAEPVELPFNYILDEFLRRRVRNDYPLLALWELGVQHVRVPLSDLLDSRYRERMAAVRGPGQRFCLFSYGIPQGEAREVLRKHTALVESLEIMLLPDALVSAVPELQTLQRETGVALRLAPLAISQEFGVDFDQYVRPGFRVHDEQVVRGLFTTAGTRVALEGVTFRVGPDEEPWEALAAIARLADELSFTPGVILQLASDSEAGVVLDEEVLAQRVVVAAAGAHATGLRFVYLDTFVDMDRGYYVRLGLIDRRYNPRLPGIILRNIAGQLAEAPRPRRVGQRIGQAAETVYRWETDAGEAYLLVSSADLAAGTRLPRMSVSMELRVIDVKRGQRVGHRVDSGADGGASPVLEEAAGRYLLVLPDA